MAGHHSRSHTSTVAKEPNAECDQFVLDCLHSVSLLRRERVRTQPGQCGQQIDTCLLKPRLDFVAVLLLFRGVKGGWPVMALADAV